MTKRAIQRAETRERILDAATLAFAEHGFRGASTRDIAARADANQGLITYHFKTKDDLWRAAAERLFDMLRDQLARKLSAIESENPREFARESIREFIRFNAEHPELFGLMLDEGKSSDARMRWIVDTQLKPLYKGLLEEPSAELAFDEALRPHAYYVIAGAASLIFAVAPECKRLTGLDPRTRDAIETHADFVARLLVP